MKSNNWDIFKDRVETLLIRWDKFSGDCEPYVKVRGFLAEINDDFTKYLCKSTEFSYDPAIRFPFEYDTCYNIILPYCIVLPFSLETGKPIENPQNRPTNITLNLPLDKLFSTIFSKMDNSEVYCTNVQTSLGISDKNSDIQSLKYAVSTALSHFFQLISFKKSPKSALCFLEEADGFKLTFMPESIFISKGMIDYALASYQNLLYPHFSLKMPERSMENNHMGLAIRNSSCKFINNIDLPAQYFNLLYTAVKEEEQPTNEFGE